MHQPLPLKHLEAEPPSAVALRHELTLMLKLPPLPKAPQVGMEAMLALTSIYELALQPGAES
jgi:hypothetical protein